MIGTSHDVGLNLQDTDLLDLVILHVHAILRNVLYQSQTKHLGYRVQHCIVQHPYQ